MKKSDPRVMMVRTALATDVVCELQNRAGAFWDELDPETQDEIEKALGERFVRTLTVMGVLEQ